MTLVVKKGDGTGCERERGDVLIRHADGRLEGSEKIHSATNTTPSTESAIANRDTMLTEFS